MGTKHPARREWSVGAPRAPSLRNIRISRVPAPASSGRTGRRVVLFLALLPIVDAVVNQVNTIYQPSIGPFSMLQVLRLLVLIGMLGAVASTRRRAGGLSSAVGRIAIAAAVCLFAIAANEMSTNGGLSRSGLIEYGQLTYWLTAWYLAAVWITDSAGAVRVLHGLVAGAAITAGSVYYAYLAGAHFSIYRLTGVQASVGWFISGKGISGSLVAGAWLAGYLGRHRRSWQATVTALFCLGASTLTYARAGMVALAASLAWACMWITVSGARSGSSWARRLVLGAACAAGIFAATIGTGDLIRRWSDVEDVKSAGSGRLMIWTAAMDSFLSGTATQQILGRGVQSKMDAIYTSTGILAGAHNDVLDMLVLGGIAGVLVLGLALAGVVIQIRSIRLRSPEAATAVAVLVVLGCQAFLTGQVFHPDTMCFYLLGITAVLAARPHPARPQSVDVPWHSPSRLVRPGPNRTTALPASAGWLIRRS